MLLQKITVPHIPDAPDQQEFQSLVSLTATEQDLVRGHALNAPKLQHLSLSFSGRGAFKDGSYIFNLTSLSSLLSLEIAHFESTADNRSPFGGSSPSVTSVTVRSSQLYGSQFFKGICGSVRELTLNRVFVALQTSTLVFPKLTRLVITGDVPDPQSVHELKFSALTALSITLPRNYAGDVPALLSTLNGENQTLRELDLHFEDDGYMLEMSSGLLDTLTRFNQLLTFSLLGALSFTGSGWNRFATSNHLLQRVTLTIRDMESNEQFITASFVPKQCVWGVSDTYSRLKTSSIRALIMLQICNSSGLIG